MIPGNANPLLLASAADAAVAGPIKSVRIDSGDNAKLTRTPSSAGNRKTWTWAGWVKLNNSSSNFFLGAGTTGTTNYTYARFGVFSNKIQFLTYGQYIFTSDALFRDYSGWGHITLVCDTTESTAADRLKVYWNGVQLTNSATTTLDSNGEYAFNNTLPHTIGSESAFGTWDGYLADLYFIDGSALDPTSFGAFDDNGVWQSATYSGTFGTNGYHLLDFANESGIGDDSSGNDNDFTVNNINNVVGNGNWISDTSATDYSTGSYGVAQMFDASLSTEMLAAANTTSTFTPTGGLAFSSSFIIYAYDQNGGTIRFNWSGGYYDLTLPTANTQNPVDVTSNLTSPITSITWSTPDIQGPYIRAIDVDGVRLVDNSYTDTDVLRDVPTNGDSSDDTGAGGEVSGNYATLNPLTLGNATLSNGNLDCNIGASNGKWGAASTIGVTSGKFYIEVKCVNAVHGNTQIGVGDSEHIIKSHATEQVGTEGQAVYYRSFNGKARVYTNGTSADSTYGDTYTQNDIIGIALNADDQEVTFYKNGTAQNSGTAISIPTTSQAIFLSLCEGGADGPDFECNFGQRAYVHSAPSGYKALCTTNLPTPTIADGSDYFDTKLWTGNSGTNAISGLEFSPDWVWIKSRSNIVHHALFDTVRGTNKYLYSSLTNAEVTGYTDTLTAFNSDGFTLGADSSNQVNYTGYTYVGWCWDAGSSTVSNTDGSITSQVRANQSAGFSIVSYTGSGAADTIGHGLNAAPEFILVKRRDAAKSWIVYHASLGNTVYLNLDRTDNQTTGATNWNSTDPTSSVFSVGGSTFENGSGATYVAYCFAPVAGYSSFGSYEGNGSASDGPFVNLNFAPAFLLVKRYDSSGNWILVDETRGEDKAVYPNQNISESSASFTWVDLVSNGFKIRSSITAVNASGGDYVYWAFASNPFSSNGGLAR